MRTRTALAPAALLAAGALLGWLAASGRLAEAFAQDKKSAGATPKPPPGFKGTIKLDIRDSKPDWRPFTPKAAPKGAPNVLVILYDDTGLAAWSPYGGRGRNATLGQPAHSAEAHT